MQNHNLTARSGYGDESPGRPGTKADIEVINTAKPHAQQLRKSVRPGHEAGYSFCLTVKGRKRLKGREQELQSIFS